MSSEIAALRSEVNEIRHRVLQIQEAYRLKKELDGVKRDLQNLLHLAKDAAAAEKQKKEEAQAMAKKAEEEQKAKEIAEKKKQEDAEKAKAQSPAPVSNPTPAPVSTTPKATTPAPSTPTPAPTTTTSTSTPTKSTTTTVQTPAKAALSGNKTVAVNYSSPQHFNKPGTATASPAKPAITPVVKATTPALNPTSDKIEEERAKQQQLERDAVFGAKHKEVAKPEFQNFGIDRDLAKKQADKYDPNLEKEAREWIEAVTDEKLDEKIASSLKSGVILCKLINKLKPNSIPKVNTSTMAFRQMENIESFIKAAKALGVSESDLFMTVDLFEEKNVNQVILCIHALGRASRKIADYTGPNIGPKEATKHEVHFTEEQLKKGHTTVGLLDAYKTDVQKDASAARKMGHSIIKSENTGTTTSQLGLLDKNKTDVQKDASAAKKMGHNIIK